MMVRFPRLQALLSPLRLQANRNGIRRYGIQEPGGNSAAVKKKAQFDDVLYRTDQRVMMPDGFNRIEERGIHEN